MLLQSYGSAGVTANITLRQAYNSLPFCRFTYAVLPRDWLIGTAQPTPAPTTPQGTGTVALTTVTHTVAVATLVQADYTGDLKLAYEVGYGAYLGIYNLSAARFEPNCSVTSSVNPRRSIEISFVAKVDDLHSGAASQAAETLDSSGSEFPETERQVWSAAYPRNAASSCMGCRAVQNASEIREARVGHCGAMSVG